MAGIRLRTKLVLALIFSVAVLTGTSLLIVQDYLGEYSLGELNEEIGSAFATFEQFARQQQRSLLQSTALTADLPNVRALMTTRHAMTIQDASADFWPLTESELLVLADPAGQVMAFHVSESGFDRDTAQVLLQTTLHKQRSRDWWFGKGSLYEVFLQPIYMGRAQDGSLLGILVAGYAVDENLSDVVARITSGDVAFRYGTELITSSLSAAAETELAALGNWDEGNLGDAPMEIRLGEEDFLAASMALNPDGIRPVTLTVLRSYDEATLFLRNVNQLLLAVGLVALVAGSGLMFLISHTLTRPLGKLVSGVVALQKGDFSYPISPESHDEIGELTMAFDSMRESLEENQRQLLHAERLATIGEMASTVSHDLRHPLTTILAYAELLSEDGLDESQRSEIYGQIRSSVSNMADLIASMLEFSKAQEELHLAYGDCVDALQDTMRAVRLRSEFDGVEITLVHEGTTQGWFDLAKLDRAFYNLLRNACEAVSPESGLVQVTVLGSDQHIDISISDNGAGIPPEIRDEVFEPFVTSGKADGTGLGLAVVEKIVRAHGGEVTVESTGSKGTTFKLTLPVLAQPTAT